MAPNNALQRDPRCARAPELERLAMIYPKTISFADGENLVLRYQSMLEEGRKPKPGVVHKSDAFVWSPDVTKFSHWSLMRVAFHTSLVGDDVLVQELSEHISSTRYDHKQGFGFLNPPYIQKTETGSEDQER